MIADRTIFVPKAQHERIAYAVRPYVYPVLFPTDSKTVVPGSSCVFINYRRRYFLATAGHVWKYFENPYRRGLLVFNNVGPDAKGTDDNFIEIPGDVILSENVGEDDDNIDLAFIELDDKWFGEQGFSAIPQRMLVGSANEKYHVIHGFVEAQNSKHIFGRSADFRPRSNYYVEENMSPLFDWSKKPMYEEGANIQTKYRTGRVPSNAGMEKRSRQVSSQPFGFSGGALWSTSLTSMNPLDIHLSGIIITKEVINSQMIVMSVKTKKLLELIDQN